MAVRIVSYNILVPIYAEQVDYYDKCDPEHLKTDYRWNLIQNQFEREITKHENTVVCIQELCLSLLPKLEIFFRRMNYSLFHNLYGGESNDYMGVGIAIPLSMQLDDISFVKIGDYIRSVCKKWENQDVSCENTEEVPDPWEAAMDRSNTLICVKVTINKRPLCIGTYHMPCMYKYPDIMAIHASIVKDLVFKYASGCNVILAGDFNFEPTTACYNELTKTGFPAGSFPKSKVYEVSYWPNTEQIFKSAYREKNGSEPAYTNYSCTYDQPVYCETLDYIFFAGQMTVDDVLNLPDRPSGRAYPDETNPSDHLLIAASFRF
ncbi:unnamed protein product [Adineta ricciae]|uniref:Endonuclease/exonuclease/phosphatase domain-containing protein n=1 Tax=Adineta ricciae TaxID=249248 RepID=A0A815ZYC9_ADIRI|nr:unnamed protein product [Adineta ricciae]